LAATGLLWSVFAPTGSAQQAPEANEAARAGHALFLQGCATCHGLHGEGSTQGPSLVGVGSAAVDFQLSTGRMPLAAPGAQAPVKPGSYSDTEIAQIAAYVQTLGGGPEVPEVTDEQLRGAELAHGGELFRANCAQCHQAAGAGAPLTYGKFAPALSEASPVQVIEAMRTGPESMPVFGPGQIPNDDAVAIANYITTMRDTPSPGGHKLGNYGPVPEGLLAWLVGIGGLLAVCLWIGARQRV
jgi:ubiquinol-cytochrome c reductase cytochrome c subunit